MAVLNFASKMPAILMNRRHLSKSFAAIALKFTFIM